MDVNFIRSYCLDFQQLKNFGSFPILLGHININKRNYTGYSGTCVFNVLTWWNRFYLVEARLVLAQHVPISLAYLLKSCIFYYRHQQHRGAIILLVLSTVHSGGPVEFLFLFRNSEVNRNRKSYQTMNFHERVITRKHIVRYSWFMGLCFLLK